MCGSGYPTYPDFLPYPKLLFPFWSNFSSEKENGKQGVHFERFFLLHEPIALRQAKTVYNFGLSQCNRVKRKTLVLLKDIKIIFCNTGINLLFSLSEVGTHILRKKKSFLPTYPNFFQAVT